MSEIGGGLGGVGPFTWNKRLTHQAYSIRNGTLK